MLSRLRASSGAPSMRVRLTAALVVAGLVIATAPVVVVPIVRFLIHTVA